MDYWSLVIVHHFISSCVGGSLFGGHFFTFEKFGILSEIPSPANFDLNFEWDINGYVQLLLVLLIIILVVLRENWRH